MTTRRFTGQYHEQALPGGEGLAYYNARWYDPQLGRFVSPDSIVPSPSNPQSLNRFSYVRNNPLNRIDPTGHRDECGISTESCGCPNCSPILGYAAKRKKPTGKLIGFEFALPFKKTTFGKTLSRIPIVSKLLDKTPLGTVAGLELVRLNKGGDMKLFFITGTGPTPNRSSRGDGTHYSIYVGNMYNLEDVNNYGHPFTMPKDSLTSFSGLRELYNSRYARLRLKG